MRLNELSDNAGAAKKKRRKARGPGSGRGKTAGRGVKGQGSRSGVSLGGFEGGQNPLYRRLPKRGMSGNLVMKDKDRAISLSKIVDAVRSGLIQSHQIVDANLLESLGWISSTEHFKLIGPKSSSVGPVLSALILQPDKITQGAIDAASRLGATVEDPAPRETGVRWLDILPLSIDGRPIGVVAIGFTLVRHSLNYRIRVRGRGATAVRDSDAVFDFMESQARFKGFSVSLAQLRKVGQRGVSGSIEVDGEGNPDIHLEFRYKNRCLLMGSLSN